MARRKDIDGSMSVPTFYGKELRWKREAAGLSLEGLLEGSFYGKSYLSDIEHGERRMPMDLARHVDRVLGTDKFFERNCEDVRKARRGGHAEYFINTVEMEERAQEIDEWGPALIPGPLQLEPYIRAVVLAAHPQESEEAVVAKIEARRARAWLLEDQHAPDSWLVLHESILREPIVPPDAMADQLAHLAEVARRRRVIPQILPRNGGAHPFMMGTTRFMTFADAPPVMYTEGMYSGQLVDDPALVRQYAKAYGRLRAAALSPEVSLKLIEQAAEDYRKGRHS
ncbi:helix-turn-helix transcriptional regulator [Streptomyces sp. ISL-12]|uniref:helix-turn-helix domain-containing protein n=1 Tax=Streptomyces sp. ISL-12 TaxID=2819177 RepID=UPI001BE74268|nr:helix-turn-helix transcriptional regulator [Streptomyces sp. ISL-12]MBT2409249.1 helix-turn-helix transcriptional regulator [Streptomyces sp. ISL-12]